jgi:hypothetical protein
MRVLVTGTSGGPAPFVIRALWEQYAEHRLDACTAALEQLFTQWIPTTLRSAGPSG